MLNMYAGSLYNIAQDIVIENPQTPEAEDRICRRWGRTLDDITKDEADYIASVIMELRN